MIKSTGLSLAGARSEFFRVYDRATFPWERFCMHIKSDKDVEHYRWLGSVPTMRPWGTGRLAKGLRSESYDVRNEKYEVTIEIDRDEESDDQTGQIAQRIRSLAAAARDHKPYLLAQLLANGASAGFVSYDGITFFNDAHVSGKSGQQDNDLTAVAAAATKTTPECKAALVAAVGALLGFKDDQGEPMNVSPTGIVVVVPVSMYFAMLEAATAGMIASTDNVLRGLAIEVLPMPWLTNTKVFYTFTLGGEDKPFIFQEREPLDFKVVDPGYDQVTGFMKEKKYAGCRARYKMTYGFWQKAVRTSFNN